MFARKLLLSVTYELQLGFTRTTLTRCLSPIASHSTAGGDVMLSDDDVPDHVCFTGRGAVTSEARSFDEMPGPRGVPFIGNGIKYSKLGPYKFEKILENRLAYKNKYGKIYKEKLGTMRMVNLFDPSDLATMFHLEGKYPSRGKIPNLEVTYLKRNNKLLGFAFLDGPEWSRQRGCIQQLMMHPFATSKYLSWQMPIARNFADYLGNRRQVDGLVPNLYDELFKYTMESIGAVCFGSRVGAFSENREDAKRLAAAISETLVCFRNCMFSYPWYQYLRTPTYRRFERAADDMRQIMSKYVKAVERRTEAATTVVRPTLGGGGGCPFASTISPDDKALCVFEMMMKDPRISHELAVNLVMALFRTGIDSTGNSLAFLLHNLAANPDKQELLYDEIREKVPVDGVPDSDTLQTMTYLKACLKESFRLHYPVFGGSGRVMPEDTVFSGYRVPKGVFIFANLAAMCRMEEYFPRPLEYHPERWLRDERAALKTDWPQDSAYLCLPFSHGLRACPGKRLAEQGLYMAAIAIIQKFRIVTDNKHMGMIHLPFTVPDRPLDIKFIQRDESIEEIPASIRMEASASR